MVVVTSLYETLHQFSDARRGQGKRYELALILCLLILAKLAGQTSLSGATDWIRHRTAETCDKGHGRLQHRQITCSPDLNDWFGKDWQGIEQVFRLERSAHLLKTNQIRHEVVYGLSNPCMRQAPPARMLSLVRDHWAIEKKLQYRRDGSLGEDTCQTRTGPVPHLLAQLNSTALSLMDRLGVRNVARQMRSFDAHPEQAFALVLTGSCFVYENWKALILFADFASTLEFCYILFID